MSDQLSNLLIITLLALALLLAWVFTIGIAFWDVSRRKLSGAETALWMALVVLLPGIGFAAYLFSRLLGMLFSPGDLPDRPQGPRYTLFKRQPQAVPRTGTLPAADLVQPTAPASPSYHAAVPASQVQKFKLAVVEGPHLGREFLLDSLPVSIGRGPEAAIRLDEDLGVSRQHAEIYEQDGVLRIRDLKSTHGTHVNDFSIDDKSLDPGDRIRVGLSTLLVSLEAR